MSNQLSESTEEAWIQLVRAHHAVLSGVERALKRGGYPPLAWYDCLLELDRAGESGLRPLELEKQLLLPQYGLSRLLKRIEEAGYIQRRKDPKDARAQTVHITEDGLDLRRRMWPVYASALQSALGEKLEEKQARKLTKVLKKVL